MAAHFYNVNQFHEKSIRHQNYEFHTFLVHIKFWPPYPKYLAIQDFDIQCLRLGT